MKAFWTCTIGLVLLCGCGGDDAASTSPQTPSTPGGEVTPASASADEVFLCGGCGQIKGSDTCCAEGAEKCDKCELAKGSPGCCVIASGDDVKLCKDCGQVAGGDACCDESAEKCGECGLAEGSPGCCKLDT